MTEISEVFETIKGQIAYWEAKKKKADHYKKTYESWLCDGAIQGLRLLGVELTNKRER